MAFAWRSSGRYLLVAMIVSIAAGCGQSSAPAIDSPAVTPEVTPIEAPTTAGKPDVSQRTDIGMYHGKGVVRVGDSVSQALAVFPDAPRSYPVNELPKSFKRPYAAKGWETATSSEGFGVITYEDVVVAALHHIEHADRDRLSAILKEHETGLRKVKNVFVAGMRVNYWFWSDEGQTLMICSDETDPKNFKITVAMGDNRTLDALGISPEKAKHDATHLDTELRKSTDPADTTTPN